MGLCVQVAVIKSAGTEQQQVWTSSIARAADDLHGERLSPCIIVVGNATKIRALSA